MPRSTSNTPARQTKVLIVDDHPAVREALAARISQLPSFAVCGEAADVPEAVQLIDETQPDLVVVDITLKNGNGLDLIKRIKAKSAEIRILVWSMHGEHLYAERAMRAGAMGYITKEQAMSRIIDALQQVAAGKIYLSPEMSERLLHRAIGGAPTPLECSPVDALSDRELEVFRLIGQHVKTADIAKQLHLSQATIWTYRDRIREKLDLGDGADLVRYAADWVRENA